MKSKFLKMDDAIAEDETWRGWKKSWAGRWYLLPTQYWKTLEKLSWIVKFLGYQDNLNS